MKKLLASICVGAALAAASMVWFKDLPAGLLRIDGGLPVPVRSVETDIHIPDVYYVIGWPIVINFVIYSLTVYSLLVLRNRRRMKQVAL